MAILKGILLMKENQYANFYKKRTDVDDMYICRLCDTNCIKKENMINHINEKHLVHDEIDPQVIK